MSSDLAIRAQCSSRLSLRLLAPPWLDMFDRRSTHGCGQRLLEIGHVALAALLQVTEDGQYARAALRRVVFLDVQIRNALQAQASKPAAHEGHRMGECAQR